MTRRRSLPLLAAAWVLGPALATPAAEKEVKSDAKVARSIVKIVCSRRQVHAVRPWINLGDQEHVGSGVVIDGKRVLTSAHVVAQSRQIFVQPNESADKFAAKVLAIAPDVDLAVLALEDDSFFDRYPPLARSAVLPKVKDTVLVQGYPVGGEDLSTTRGIVSRIEFTGIYYLTMGLRVQIDAAINPGNFGGPAVVGNEMVGIIFSRLNASDNIGYIVPNEEVELFLNDLSDGRYDGKPALLDELQSAQNDMLRRRLRLEKGNDGWLVTHPDDETPGNPLRPWDLITKIGDQPIDGAGMVIAAPELRLDFRYLVQKVAKDGKVPLEVVRGGKLLRLDVPAPSAATRPRLLPFLFDKRPPYLVWGPLVFTVASYEYLTSFEATGAAEHWLPYLVHNRSPLVARGAEAPKFEGEQLVVVAALLPHRLSKGYNDPSSAVVDEVNGVKVRNFRHLAELLRDAQGEFVTISFSSRGADTFVFDRKQVAESMEDILSGNSIRKAYSDDLKDVYEVKK